MTIRFYFNFYRRMTFQEQKNENFNNYLFFEQMRYNALPAIQYVIKLLQIFFLS